MRRFQAPADVSGITLSIGPLAVTNGFVETADDLPIGDVMGLLANRFAEVQVSAAEKAAALVAAHSKDELVHAAVGVVDGVKPSDTKQAIAEAIVAAPVPVVLDPPAPALMPFMPPISEANG